eukprot:EG_transcript_20615
MEHEGHEDGHQIRNFIPRKDQDVESCMDFLDIEKRIHNVEHGGLLPRNWSIASLGQPTCEEGFIVMQFNVLARGLSSGPGTELFPSTKPNSFGDFAVDGSIDIIFDWDRRKWMLLAEILRFGPAIIAMEEVDHFPDFFQPVLAKAGYEGVFRPKERSPSVDFGFFPDGIALFWNSQTFSKLRDESGSLPAHPGVPYLLLTLRHAATQREVVVAAVHLKAKATQSNEDIREQSIMHVLSRLEENSGGHPQPVLLLGDFNTGPFDVDDVLKAKAIPAVLRNRSLNLRSAYRLPSSAEDIGQSGYW